MKNLALLTTFALFSTSAMAQDLLPYRLKSRNSKHPRAIAASCAGYDASNKCNEFVFYFVDDSGNATQIGTQSVRIATMEDWKVNDSTVRNVFTESSKSATGAAVEFVHDADGSYGDSKFADIAKGATRGVGYVVATPIGVAGDVIGYPIGTTAQAIHKMFRNPKLNKLISVFQNEKDVNINVGKVDTLHDIIFCATQDPREAMHRRYAICE